MDENKMEKNLVEYAKLRNDILNNLMRDDEEYVKSLCWVPVTPLKLRVFGLESYNDEWYQLYFSEDTVERYLKNIKHGNTTATYAIADSKVVIESYNLSMPYLEFRHFEDLMKFIEDYNPIIYADGRFEHVYKLLQYTKKEIKK